MKIKKKNNKIIENQRTINGNQRQINEDLRKNLWKSIKIKEKTEKINKNQ